MSHVEEIGHKLSNNYKEVFLERLHTDYQLSTKRKNNPYRARVQFSNFMYLLNVVDVDVMITVYMNLTRTNISSRRDPMPPQN